MESRLSQIEAEIRLFRNEQESMRSTIEKHRVEARSDTVKLMNKMDKLLERRL